MLIFFLPKLFKKFQELWATLITLIAIVLNEYRLCKLCEIELVAHRKPLLQWPTYSRN